jgi:2-polyprenyl-6-methoxyphenol hydroxylase-like FAD-dependent oxidoreductase
MIFTIDRLPLYLSTKQVGFLDFKTSETLAYTCPSYGSQPRPDEFKVLIAGGSLVGLGLALCFERAGIDYELFEKGDFAPQLGASIGIHPHTIRILEQLGVRADIEKQVIPLQHRKHYAGDGSCFEDSHVLVKIQGMYVHLVVRRQSAKSPGGRNALTF